MMSYEYDPSVDMGGYVPLSKRASFVGSKQGERIPFSEGGGQIRRSGGIFPSRGEGIALRSSSLDINRQNVPKPNSWSKKQKRAFHRILSGFHRANGRNERIRFMTLTTAKYEDYSRLNADFQVLRKRAKRKLNLKLDYFKIRTNEGFGVLHCLTKGGFLPQKWLSRNWQEIHGAKIVDIRGCFGKGKRLTNYLVKAFYSSKQSFERMSWSWGWVFKGFVGYWNTMKFGLLREGKSMKEVVLRWQGFLSKAVLFTVGTKL
jgi:hypothetical protein